MRLALAPSNGACFSCGRQRPALLQTRSPTPQAEGAWPTQDFPSESEARGHTSGAPIPHSSLSHEASACSPRAPGGGVRSRAPPSWLLPSPKSTANSSSADGFVLVGARFACCRSASRSCLTFPPGGGGGDGHKPTVSPASSCGAPRASPLPLPPSGALRRGFRTWAPTAPTPLPQCQLA